MSNKHTSPGTVPPTFATAAAEMWGVMATSDLRGCCSSSTWAVTSPVEKKCFNPMENHEIWANKQFIFTFIVVQGHSKVQLYSWACFWLASLIDNHMDWFITFGIYWFDSSEYLCPIKFSPWDKSWPNALLTHLLSEFGPAARGHVQVCLCLHMRSQIREGVRVWKAWTFFKKHFSTVMKGLQIQEVFCKAGRQAAAFAAEQLLPTF